MFMGASGVLEAGRSERVPLFAEWGDMRPTRQETWDELGEFDLPVFGRWDSYTLLRSVFARPALAFESLYHRAGGV